MDRTITIGAHSGGLARAQSEHVARLLREAHGKIGVHLELVTPPDSAGDAHDDHIAENRTAIATLHELLRDEEVDLVIHRGFDLRDQIADDLVIAAVPQRDSPFEALLTTHDRALDELEDGARVGVVQLRARAQLLEHRPDLRYELIEGDMGRWLTALIDEEVDALVGPNAAFERLGLQERVTELFPPEMLVPSPCSGILLCVCRADDADTRSLLEKIHHGPSASEYEAEVAFLRGLGGAWEAPVGALAQCFRDDLLILGLVASPDGSQVLRRGIQARLESAADIGDALADLLCEEGAEDLLGILPEDGDGAGLAGLLTELVDYEELDPDEEG